MSRMPTRPVQVRLPVPIDDYLTELADERGESKTQIVVEALECLRQQLLERRMEAGYHELAEEHIRLVAAGLAAGLPVIPD
jgi:hypothetical protein